MVVEISATIFFDFYPIKPENIFQQTQISEWELFQKLILFIV